MNNGEIITSGGIQYKVIDKLGAGGQGSVYLVENQKDKQKYALKLINDKSSDRKANKIANIKHLVNAHIDADVHNACVRRGAKVNHTFPLSYFEDTASGTTGYIMECASGKTLGKLLISGEIAKMKFEDKLKLIKVIAQSIDVLHDIGYCYTDISFGNFMWDSSSEVLSVIDCENVSCQQDIDSGKNLFLIGTGFFIAPEVAFRLKEQSRVSKYSDRYALATLFFGILTNGLITSPYHGKALFTADPIPQNMQEVAEYEDEDEIDKNWRVFIFDPQNKSNSIDDLLRNSTNAKDIERRKEFEQAIRIWGTIHEELKKLFYKAFSDPFDYKSRPLPSQWVRIVDTLLGKPPKTPQPPITPQPSKPHLEYNGKNVEINSSHFVIEGKDLGLSTKIIGELQKTTGGYVFKSSSLMIITIYDSNGREKATLKKGETITLNSGDSILLAITAKKIKIVF